MGPVGAVLVDPLEVRVVSLQAEEARVLILLLADSDLEIQLRL